MNGKRFNKVVDLRRLQTCALSYIHSNRRSEYTLHTAHQHKPTLRILNGLTSPMSSQMNEWKLNNTRKKSKCSNFENEHTTRNAVRQLSTQRNEENTKVAAAATTLFIKCKMIHVLCIQIQISHTQHTYIAHFSAISPFYMRLMKTDLLNQIDEPKFQ